MELRAPLRKRKESSAGEEHTQKRSKAAPNENKSAKVNRTRAKTKPGRKTASAPAPAQALAGAARMRAAPAKAELPADRYYKQLDEVVARCNGLGVMVVRGLPVKKGQEDAENPEPKKKYEKLTDSDLKALRYIVIDKARDKYLTQIMRQFLGKNYDREWMMFGTSDSFPFIVGIEEEVYKTSFRPLPERFNRLLAVTTTCDMYDFWYYRTDMPDEAAMVIRLLGFAWMDLLMHTDEELGIDSEFTRPGIEALLRDLAKKFAKAAKLGLGDFKMRWKL